jgi:DNA polymerase-4
MQARFNDPVQDAMEMRRYIMQKMQVFEQSHSCATMLNSGTRQMGVTVMDFVHERNIQYTLFDNRLKQDHLRKVLYGIKDKWGKYTVRKATELIQHSKMKDAIGFGSVKDLYEAGGSLNKYMLEETEE